MGTLRYMAPEQALGKRGIVDPRADIYSLGATLYELTTPHPLYTDVDREALLKKIMFEEPESPAASTPPYRLSWKRSFSRRCAKRQRIATRRNDPETQYRTASAALRVGDVRASPADPKEGVAAYRTAATLFAKLDQSHPTNRRTYMEGLVSAYI